MSFAAYRKEVDTNFASWERAWRKELAKTTSELGKNDALLCASYRRLVSLQAWRSFLDGRTNEYGIGFFLEAQNDGLTSLVLASTGAWRVALQTLRSCIENVFAALYYKDHPIEAVLWTEGKHRLSAQDAINYYRQHPSIGSYPAQLTGLDTLPAEYATLSRAVHASAVRFRMTSGESTRLFSSEGVTLSQWASRQKRVISALNLLLVASYAADLTGTQNSGLRQAISLAIPNTKYQQIQSELQIRLLHT